MSQIIKHYDGFDGTNIDIVAVVGPSNYNPCVQFTVYDPEYGISAIQLSEKQIVDLTKVLLKILSGDYTATGEEIKQLKAMNVDGEEYGYIP